MDESQLGNGVTVLRNGGIVAFPTDTVFGLGAQAENSSAVMRVFQVKRRSLDQPVPLLISDLSMLSAVVRVLPGKAAALANAFWPGALTMVLPRADSVPDEVTGGGDSVGVRMPDHDGLRRLIRSLGAPVVGTSANRSGHPSPLTSAEVRAQLGGDVDYVIEGRCTGVAESTVIDLTGPTVSVVRQGAVEMGDIERALGSAEAAFGGTAR